MLKIVIFRYVLLSRKNVLKHFFSPLLPLFVYYLPFSFQKVVKKCDRHLKFQEEESENMHTCVLKIVSTHSLACCSFVRSFLLLSYIHSSIIHTVCLSVVCHSVSPQKKNRKNAVQNRLCELEMAKIMVPGFKGTQCISTLRTSFVSKKMVLRVYLWVKFIFEKTVDVRYNMRNLE